jgi:hypothetical protein
MPTAEQKLDLLLATDERGQRGCVQRLEPVDAGGLASHSTGCGKPFNSIDPSARQSNMRPTSRRVLAAITTSPGAAIAWSRAAGWASRR